MPDRQRDAIEPAAAGRFAHTGAGFGKVLVLIYGIFALSATARASVQLLRDWHAAPLAYALSAFAALVYIVATVALARGTQRARLIAWAAVLVELTGVIAVGVFSYVRPDVFPQATVWSHFGQGYGFIPLILPLVGVAWLMRTGRSVPPQPAQTSPADH